MVQTLTSDSDYLFPGGRGSATMSRNDTILKALERMGYKGKHTGHGFRGVAESTLLHEQGFDHAHIELQLAHAPRNAVSASYNHALYLKPRAAMMQEWADHIGEDAAREGAGDGGHGVDQPPRHPWSRSENGRLSFSAQREVCSEVSRKRCCASPLNCGICGRQKSI